MAQFVAQWQDGLTVSWRNLTKGEYHKFKELYDNSLFVEPMQMCVALYNTVKIDGPDSRYVPAGIPAFITKHQLLNNPFSGTYEDIAPALEMARKAVTGDYLKAATAIIAATLNYKPEEIEQWDPNLFFIRLAQAEMALGRPFDPTDPKAPKDAQGNPISNKKIKKPLTPTQQKALERTRSRAA